ncbi:hypothetical protein B0J15DRAFT_431837 [Fusarium solani]|jgi:hypothetical protein|uniref:2EXR domain-containing protein n=1 Tax=Fusarium solani TaxID=169388 RepID=A0A9P9GAN6_FUSSL|nr:uncharacterized protein B0J15DRAFT_431837 [Fusarium solani]KAH7234429.1 hypothetical protein B0J15DRAFT_431837 [Fusarium solani]
MTTKPHLQIFKIDAPQSNADLKEFTLFSKLPTELRFKIWKHSLEHPRILKVHLRYPSAFDSKLAYDGQTRPASHQSQNYRPVVEGYQTLSKLLRVNKDSRGAALSFYRVHLPCWLTKGASRSDDLVPATIYFNPEYDFLHVKQESMDMIDFFYDLKFKYDPQHIGIRNLALCRRTLGNNPCRLAPLPASNTNPEAMRAFNGIISQLEEVFFVSVQNIARMVLGRDTGALMLYETSFNRSFPITGMALSFDRIGRDPRQAGEDFKSLSIMGSPHELYTSWLEAMEGMGIDPPKAQYRILLTFRPYGRIYNEQDARKWVQKEDEIWNGTYEYTGPFSTIDWKTTAGSSLPKFRDEDLDKAVRPTFGFWLFPVDAFDDGSERGSHSNQISAWDVSEHWPELALLRLPPS